MKTFEEYQFKIKHGQISNVSEEKKIEELEVGDWFYFINDILFHHCQITKIVNTNKEFMELYFNGDFIQKWTVYYDEHVEDYMVCDGKGAHWCITTLPDIAEEWHQSKCPDKELKEFPAK